MKRNLKNALVTTFGLAILLIAFPVSAADVLPITLSGEFQQANYEKLSSWYGEIYSMDIQAALGAYGSFLPPELMQHYYDSSPMGPLGCASMYNPGCQCTSSTGLPSFEGSSYAISGGCSGGTTQSPA